MHSNSIPSIAIIVVTYNSDVESLKCNLAAMAPHFMIVICDNSTDEQKRNRIRDFTVVANIAYLSMTGNQGIAYAQNKGFIFAKEAGVDFVLLLDDDSVFSPESIRQLANSLISLQSQGHKVGMIGARAFSHQGKDLSNAPIIGGGLTPCSLMTSSGSLIPVSVLVDVGGMDESLFIDCVDFEWGWRALDKGYQLLLNDSIRFQHALGQGEITRMGMTLRVPAPIRHYYQTRNVLRLLARPYIPTKWKIRQVLAILTKFVIFTLFVPPRLARGGFMIRGLLDAIRGRMGVLNSRLDTTSAIQQ